MDLLYAHCEIDDAPDVIRDTVLAIRHADASPLDCSYRITVGGEFAGSGWMRFDQDHAECESYTRNEGRITQRIRTPGPVRWLQTHPIIGDALLMKLYDLAQGPGKQFQDNIYLCSPDHRGATGPILYQSRFSLVYLGEEPVSVEAGDFAARHFRVEDTAEGLPEEHPPYEVWCTADDEYLVLKARVGGYMQSSYELVEVQRD